MRDQLFLAALLAVTLTGCMASREGELVNPTPPAPGTVGTESPAAQTPTEPRPDSEEPVWNQATLSTGGVELELEEADFAAYAIDTSKLFFTLDFRGDDGKSINKVDRSPLDFDGVTGKGKIVAKVTNGKTGIIFLTIDDGISGNDRFAGESKRTTISGPTKIEMTLKKIGDADVTIDVSFDDGDDQQPDPDPPPGDDETPDVSGINDPALRQVALDLGDPKTMDPPTLVQVQAIGRKFCYACHRPNGSASGDATEEGFYAGAKLQGHMSGKTMPSPITSYAEQMDELADGGFDYRAALTRFSRSLDN